MKHLLCLLAISLCVSCNNAPPAKEGHSAGSDVKQTKSDSGTAKAETPKAETPKAETAKAETPKAETPKAETPKDDGWVELFNGKDLSGWKINENPESWSVKDGAIVVNGQRSHLFYDAKEPFVNFELEAVIMTKENSNSGVYFHTQFQDGGWPKYGFEAQVNNTYKDPQKTASLYGVVKQLEAPAKDDEWFTMNIRVEGKHVVVKINGAVVTDYTEADDAVAGTSFTRVVDKGTFALQGHDPGSTVLYKSLRVKRL